MASRGRAPFPFPLRGKRHRVPLRRAGRARPLRFSSAAALHFPPAAKGNDRASRGCIQFPSQGGSGSGLMSPSVARSERDHAASLGRVALHFPSVVQGGGSGLEWPHPISLASPREAAVASCPPRPRRRSANTAASPGGYAPSHLRRRGKRQRPRRPGTISREGSSSGFMSPSVARTGRSHGC